MADRAWIVPALGLAGIAAVVGVTISRRLPQTLPAPAPVAPPAACTIDLHDVAPPPAPDKLEFAIHEARAGWPVVRADVGGCAVTAFLDTGVSAEALAPWFVERPGAARSDAPTGTASDLAGREGPVFGIEPVIVDLPIVATKGPVGSVLGGPDRMKTYGVAAIMPPQFSIPPGRVMALDLAAGTYRKLASEAAADALSKPPQTFETTTECDGTLRVPVTIGGRAALFEIDTGSTVTVIASESEAGGPIAARVVRWDVQDHTGMGGEQQHALVTGVPLAVGNLHALMAVDVWRGRGHVGMPCGFDGVLGSDFLIDRRCLLLFDSGPMIDAGVARYSRVRGYCQP